LQERLYIEAEQLARMAVRLSPEDSKSHLYLSVAVGKLALSLESALANLRRAVDLAPDIIPHRVELGITLASAGQWAEAKTELEQALRMPRTWATNAYYWELARRKLEDLSAQLNR
jgi:Flp pilus assembly protein TadD